MRGTPTEESTGRGLIMNLVFAGGVLVASYRPQIRLVRVFHLSEPAEWPPPILPSPRNSPAILLRNPPLPLRSRSDTESDTELWGGASVVELKMVG
jgi:hypothetical protein